MRQFHVPQFIEIEDKIFGPLSLRQFLYLGGGAAIIVILYFSAPLWLVVVVGAPFAALAAALAFYNIHGQPFVRVVGNFFSYFFHTKLYLWKKTDRPTQAAPQKTPAEHAANAARAPKLSQQKLKDLSWSLDVRERSE